MQIDPNSHIPSTSQPAMNRVPRRVSVRQAGGASFDQAAQLNEALRQTSEVRPEMVSRGRVLIGDVKYPPDETIQSIARLLAMKLEGDEPA